MNLRSFTISDVQRRTVTAGMKYVASLVSPNLLLLKGIADFITSTGASSEPAGL